MTSDDELIGGDELQEIIQEFVVECTDLIDSATRDLVGAEKNPSPQVINSLFRAVHTIKGTAGFLGFTHLASLAHRAEDVLGRARKGEINLEPAIITTLLKAMDVMKLLVDDINICGTEASSGTEPSSGKDASSGKEERDITRLLEELEMIAGKPAETVVRTDTFLPGPTENVSAMLQEAMNQPVESAVESAAESTTESPAKTIEPERTVSNEPAGQDGAKALSGKEQTVRVDVRKLDDIMNLAGELVLGKNRLRLLNVLLKEKEETHDTLLDTLTEVTHYIEVITNDLQVAVMKARLVPVSKLFNKVPRLVRDLCAACGKETELQIEGGETELDKSLIETLHDPLTHVIRNAVDHGIEGPAERRGKGKNPKGTILLKAYSQGNQVVIEIVDDGRGIDVDALRAKVIEKGLALASEVERMPAEEVSNFIFVPGFSTAREVTSVSGRGVGMDVVKTNIERINGHVYVNSEKGRWTRLIITLPLTLAIMKALLVRVGGDLYALPLSVVLEVVKPKQGLVKTVRGSEVLVLREEIIPLLPLSRILSCNLPSDDEGSVIICKGPDRPIGLRVDTVVGQEEVVIKTLGEFLKGVKWVSGATIRGDGEIALILDLAGIVANFYRQRVAA
jgi:two-component system, chemotaxis family, sensor kinase CheA